jgi:hypothetical protein
MHSLPPVEAEFEGSEFPDLRLLDRAVKTAAMFEREPTMSIPRAAGSRGQSEAVYRFFANERVDLQMILAGHFEQTVARAAQKTVLAIHDTTAFSFSGDREGVGEDGFFAHVCLAVVPSLQPEAIGLLGMDTWVRPKRKGKRRSSARQKEKGLESERWQRQATAVEEMVSSTTELIHVEDREGDIYGNMAARLELGMRFITRATSHRVVLNSGEKENVMEAARKLPRLLTRQAQVSAQKPRPNVPPKSRQERNAREATLSIGAGQLQLRAPLHRGGKNSNSTRLNAVHVTETKPPEGVAPIEWLLLTSEPIETAEDVAFVVDSYRARWLIEEYFRALKSGCKYEERQLESLSSLLNALGIFAILAWRLLALRHLERTSDDLPATAIATPDEIAVLRAKKLLPAKPTATQFLAAVARRGGHLSNNGRPGFLVLWRGLAAIQALAEGWALAKNSVG